MFFKDVSKNYSSRFIKLTKIIMINTTGKIRIRNLLSERNLSIIAEILPVKTAAMAP